MGINEDKVRKLSHELKKALTRLKALSSLPKEEFVSDPDKIGSAKYHFLVAIEAAIDLCNHIITKNNYRPPEDYADTFRVMGEAEIFNGAFVKDLVSMAKFRNRLVHIYWEVDDELLYKILTTNLSDIERFLKELGAQLKMNI
ncbi:hypothetical protein Psch_02719 [Pelotomaculum schinkii]|uniref:DUF86 domain-containing protein n=1 Tax=Pelotomaculum schinkii TaxID=78350 RepID=A0A4Y7R9P2_9FIRM|nr:DUF86 domain-containing protein [Pelotomaculum schinkii]TEB05678.1 hypothetical protein Psch_02719 [Pelotomaculum schinkii]